jgi:predicted RNA-binding Zn ribbon-like protein
LRTPLADAERCLNGSVTATSNSLWHLLADTAGDRGQVNEAVDALLADTVSGWRLGAEDGRSKVMLTGRSGLEPAELAAVQAVALVFESGGNRRLRRCRRSGCDEVFLDWTNAGTRRVCRAHGKDPH